MVNVRERGLEARIGLAQSDIFWEHHTLQAYARGLTCANLGLNHCPVSGP